LLRIREDEKCWQKTIANDNLDGHCEIPYICTRRHCAIVMALLVSELSIYSTLQVNSTSQLASLDFCYNEIHNPRRSDLGNSLRGSFQLLHGKVGIKLSHQITD
jgi:hypothetical protein